MDFNQYLHHLPRLVPFNTLDDSYRKLGIIKNKSPFRLENRDLFYLMNKSKYEFKYKFPRTKPNNQHSQRHHSYQNNSPVSDSPTTFQQIRDHLGKLHNKQQEGVKFDYIQQPQFRQRSKTLIMQTKQLTEDSKQQIKLQKRQNAKIILKDLWDINYSH